MHSAIGWIKNCINITSFPFIFLPILGIIVPFKKGIQFLGESCILFFFKTDDL